MAHEWDPGLFLPNTAEFDRAIHQLRRAAPAGLAANLPLISELASRLKGEPGITIREFDRRFRLIVATVAQGDASALRTLAAHLRTTSPDALNSIRTLLPAELRHFAVPLRTDASSPSSIPAVEDRDLSPSPRLVLDTASPREPSKYRAVALIGTEAEHVRNEALLNGDQLVPLHLRCLDDLWTLAPTGLCGFVVGGSVWRQIVEADQRLTVRRICEYSTFLFARVCIDGLDPAVEQTFLKDAADARCGPLDGSRFCHGRNSDLTRADIEMLLTTAAVLEAAGTADFFPLGLTEADASLLRLIADRRHPGNPLTIRRLGTRELAGGRSGARVFLLNDGSAKPFVAKVDAANSLTSELQRYQQWIQAWELNVTSPTFHSHLGSAAISYLLQPAPDGEGAPAPTLEDRLEELRCSEWTRPISESWQLAGDLFRAVSRAADRLAVLNSRPNSAPLRDDFWLEWPVRDLAANGIDFTIIDRDWQPISVSKLVEAAMSRLKPHLASAVVLGDFHGRNILLIDRLPVFIDFAWSGPGHPLVDLVRLDAVVRSTAMRMLSDKRSMQEWVQAIYIDGTSADAVLAAHPAISASPLASLAVRSAAKIRESALVVAEVHSLGLPDFLGMTSVVSAHVLAVRHSGSGIERLVLSVVGPEFLTSKTQCGRI